MSLFRCTKCAHLREVGNDYIGKSAKCPKCSEVTPIYDTVAFVMALLRKHAAQGKRLQELRDNIPAPAKEAKVEQSSDYFDEIDIHNTTAFTQAQQFEPILKWFKERQIEVEINQDAIDTTGFFDEIALSLGRDFETLKFVSDQVKYVQNKGYQSVKLDMANKSAAEIKKITAFCAELYDYSFVARYAHQKKDKVIRLTLQTAPKIKHFWNGIWMEWFVLMELLQYFQQESIAASCMRSLEIKFQNDKANELDLFFVDANGNGYCIECKTGEFRHDIDKFLTMRRQLKLDKQQFVICVFGLSTEQAKGMSAMYDLTFTNELTLIEHIESCVGSAHA